MWRCLGVFVTALARAFGIEKSRVGAIEKGIAVVELGMNN